MNVERIEQPFEASELKSRPGSYGKLLTYAPLKSYLQRMNAAFDYEWSMDVVKVERDENEIIAIVRVSADGVSKTQAGCKRIVRNDQGEAFALGDDTKAAISDGFKKCCQLFGIGLHLLDDDEDATIPDARGKHSGNRNGIRQRATTRTVGGITEKQLGFIKSLRAELGWPQEDVRGLSERLFGTEDVLSLNATQGSALIAEMKKHQAAARESEPVESVPF